MNPQIDPNMKSTMKKCLLASLMAVASLNLSAEVRLPSVICDGMVLQRGQPISIWGWADSEGRWELNDILIGDVFLCSGQSNMELPIRRVTDMRYDRGIKKVREYQKVWESVRPYVDSERWEAVRDKFVIQESDARWWNNRKDLLRN